MLEFVRIIKAAQNFNISDKFEFIQFDDMTFEDETENVSLPTSMEIFAEMKISYDGELPESYKALNLMIGDWVEKHIDPLSTVIHENLKDHVNKNYPDSDVSDLDDDETTVIWTDQLDYMPRVDENSKTIVIDVELVLHAEPLEGEDDD
jgi:hypothetical protein